MPDTYENKFQEVLDRWAAIKMCRTIGTPAPVMYDALYQAADEAAQLLRQDRQAHWAGKKGNGTIESVMAWLESLHR